MIRLPILGILRELLRDGRDPDGSESHSLDIVQLRESERDWQISVPSYLVDDPLPASTAVNLLD